MQADGLAVVGQDGVARYLRAASGIQEVASRKQHELETWCVEVASMDSNLILTGKLSQNMICQSLCVPCCRTLDSHSVVPLEPMN